MSSPIYFVEALRSPYPDQPRLEIKTHRFNRWRWPEIAERLSPNVTALFRVEGVKNRSEAIAAVVEHAAGLTQYRVTQMIGGEPPQSRISGVDAGVGK